MKNPPNTSVDAVTYSFFEASNASEQYKHDTYPVEWYRSRHIDATVQEHRIFDRYFERFTQHGVRLCLPWRVFDSQGHMLVYCSGGDVIFESIDAIMDYNHTLLNQWNTSNHDRYAYPIHSVTPNMLTDLPTGWNKMYCKNVLKLVHSRLRALTWTQG